jgi:murein DD-endopeptidase MepM/ murein hydrolase activator NlpD
MPPEETRRKKKKIQYDILVVPSDEAGEMKSFRFSALRFWVLGGMMFVIFLGLTLAALVYTPLALYVPIPNPSLEQKYGRQIAETQRRLNGLAEEMLSLSIYNLQLRKALGEQIVKDSVITRSSPVTTQPGEPVAVEPTDQSSGEKADEGGRDRDYSEAAAGPIPYNAVVTSDEGFHGAFPLLVPTEGFVTAGFDPSRKHFGIDLAAKRGSPVQAATDGFVIFSGWTYDDGNMLMISHGGGYVTVYKHNQTLFKTTHAYVKRGEVIALLGSSGKTSLGSHLHFEVWKDGIPQDPDEFFLTSSKRKQGT